MLCAITIGGGFAGTSTGKITTSSSVTLSIDEIYAREALGTGHRNISAE